MNRVKRESLYDLVSIGGERPSISSIFDSAQREIAELFQCEILTYIRERLPGLMNRRADAQMYLFDKHEIGLFDFAGFCQDFP